MAETVMIGLNANNLGALHGCSAIQYLPTLYTRQNLFARNAVEIR